MIRGIVKSVVQGVIQRVSATVWGDGSLDNRELMQHYGVTSRPKAGAEVIFIRQGNHFLAIASDDRRYRIALAEGEMAIYDDLGQKVHLTRTGIVLKSAIKVTIDTPELEVTGNISAGGNVSDQKGSMDKMRTTYNSHTHVDPQGGTTPPPTQEMT